MRATRTRACAFFDRDAGLVQTHRSVVAQRIFAEVATSIVRREHRPIFVGASGASSWGAPPPKPPLDPVSAASLRALRALRSPPSIVHIIVLRKSSIGARRAMGSDGGASR